MANKTKQKEESKDEKDDKQDKIKYASLGKRFVAFVIDILIISFVASMICVPFLNVENSNKLEDEYLKNTQAFFDKKINIEDYQEIQVSYVYNSAKESGLTRIVTVILGILYFGLLQFYLKGQTLGKKILHIKVKSDDGELSINQLLFRALIVDSLILDIILFVTMMFMNKNTYYYSAMTFELIQYIVYFVCMIMIIKNNDNKGIHDVLFHTSVIEE